MSAVEKVIEKFIKLLKGNVSPRYQNQILIHIVKELLNKMHQNSGTNFAKNMAYMCATFIMHFRPFLRLTRKVSKEGDMAESSKIVIFISGVGHNKPTKKCHKDTSWSLCV